MAIGQVSIVSAVRTDAKHVFWISGLVTRWKKEGDEAGDRGGRMQGLSWGCKELGCWGYVVKGAQCPQLRRIR